MGSWSTRDYLAGDKGVIVTIEKTICLYSLLFIDLTPFINYYHSNQNKI